MNVGFAENGEVTSVEGNSCGRGKKYAPGRGDQPGSHCVRHRLRRRMLGASELSDERTGAQGARGDVRSQGGRPLPVRSHRIGRCHLRGRVRHGGFPHRDEIGGVGLSRRLVPPPSRLRLALRPATRPTPVPSAASKRDPLPAFSIRAVFLQCGRLFSQSYTIIGLYISGRGAVKPERGHAWICT